MKQSLKARIRIGIILFTFLATVKPSNVYATTTTTTSTVCYIALEEQQRANAYRKIDYTDEDIDLLARLMYAEVGIFLQTLSEEEAEEAHLLTGSVVINRVRLGIGGNNIKKVIYYPGQYDCVNNGSINNNPPDIVYEWAKELLENGPVGPDNLIFQALFEQGTNTYKQIGNTYFCQKDV